MDTVTVTLDNRFGEEYAGHYVFREITWAKRNRIIQKYTKYSRFGEVESSDFVAIQAETIMSCLVEQPEHKPLTLEKLLGETDGVPFGLGEYFSRVVNRLCSVSRDEVAFLSEQSDAANLTLTSQSTACAKSLGGRPDSLGNSQRE